MVSMPPGVEELGGEGQGNLVLLKWPIPVMYMLSNLGAEQLDRMQGEAVAHEWRIPKR